MFQKLFFFLIAFFVVEIHADLYRGVEQKKLANDVSVIFLDTNRTDELYITLCISVGKADDMDKNGKTEILGSIFKKRLKQELDKTAKSSGVEITYFIGQDESLFSLYGKKVDVSEIIKCINKVLSDLEISEEEVNREKEKITIKANQLNQLDKNLLRAEVLRTLYWHSNYGKNFSRKELQSITVKDLSEFKSKNYTNNRITLLIAGNIKKEDIEKLISDNFQNKNKSEICRLIEPSHHGSTARIEKDSEQVKIPFIEMYWKIPNYKTDSQRALTLDVFFTYLKDELKKSLIDKMHVASSLDFNYSFWSYFDGHLRLSIVANENSKELKYEILNEIRRIALEASDVTKLTKSQKELFELSNIFTYQNDIIDTMNWLSEKLGAGYDYEFLRKYPKSIKEVKLENVSEIAIKLFKNDPDVISVLNPKGKNNAI